MRALQTLLVTGGSGFIGSNLIRYIFEKTDFQGKIINLDALTYAGNPESVADVERLLGGSRYIFAKGDICSQETVEGIFQKYKPDTIIHLAAESHVDRSISGPGAFVQTNIIGTFNLLETARRHWKDRQDVLFHHVSTDEVYGSLGDEGLFSEKTPYDPRSPYSASKASSDHLVRSYYHTYDLPITLSNCSNNYGPFQFPEKMIPVMILNMLAGKALPVYGDGKNIRDWLYVEDHNSAVWEIINKGATGDSYNIGGENEWENIQLIYKLCEITADKTGQPRDAFKELINYVKDRPGHDRRYAIDCSKLKTELGWKQSVSFDEGLEKTVDWYLDNNTWIEGIKTGEYRKWMEQNYSQR